MPDQQEHGPLPQLPAALLAQGEKVHFPSKRTILPVGSAVPGLFYILEGEVRIVRLSEDGNRRSGTTVPAGDFVYETRFLASLPLSIQAETVMDTTLVLFRRDLALKLVREDAGFMSRIFDSIARKMNALGSELVETSYTRNAARLMQLLKTLARKNRSGAGEVAIRQEELAEILGVHRVTVNRILNRLEEQGTVALGRNKIYLKQP
ncbi:Crp/Fnr family transcriptional regulator [Desulfovibrio sp. OttesenSCG-928-C14]|nr:Crp/Fnr family transcriptional regulator [Desulfovibrio sp. OttesenSCG-928-C14]